MKKSLFDHSGRKGFTLVELIVVITIVGILSTVGFVSYSGYLTGARDSNRISQLTKLSDSLQVYSASKTLPLPDDKVDITASGATNVIAYQGYVGTDVLETIDYTNGGKDPKDDSYYTYYLTKDRKSMQLLALMEEAQTVAHKDTNTPNLKNIFSSSYAATYEDRYPKVYGRKLGVLTQPTTNTPVQEVTSVRTAGNLDIVTTSDQYVSHITDTETLEGTGSTLQASISNGSCNRIKQTGGAKGNGNYIINPAGAGEIRVYCDMEILGGGWTLIARSVSGGSAGNFGWKSSRGDISDDSQPYSLGAKSLDISFQEVLFAGYGSGKDPSQGFKFRVSAPSSEISTFTTTVKQYPATYKSIGTLTYGPNIGQVNSVTLGGTDITTHYRISNDTRVQILPHRITDPHAIYAGGQGMLFVK